MLVHSILCMFGSFCTIESYKEGTKSPVQGHQCYLL